MKLPPFIVPEDFIQAGWTQHARISQRSERGRRDDSRATTAGGVPLDEG